MKMDADVREKIISNGLVSLLIYALPVALMRRSALQSATRRLQFLAQSSSRPDPIWWV